MTVIFVSVNNLNKMFPAYFNLFLIQLIIVPIVNYIAMGTVLFNKILTYNKPAVHIGYNYAGNHHDNWMNYRYH